MGIGSVELPVARSAPGHTNFENDSPPMHVSKRILSRIVDRQGNMLTIIITRLAIPSAYLSGVGATWPDIRARVELEKANPSSVGQGGSTRSGPSQQLPVLPGTSAEERGEGGCIPRRGVLNAWVVK